MPKRAARSRSMVRVNVAPPVCWSLATSRSSGSVFSLSKIFDDHWFSSSRLASCRVYWYCVRVGRPPILMSCRAFDIGELRTQPSNDFVGRNVALIARLQGDEEAAVVLRLRAVGAEAHADGGNGRILQDDVREGALPAHRVGERDVLRRLRGADDEPGVLLREEALRNDGEEIAGRHQCHDEHGKSRPVVAERHIQALAV